AVALLSPPLALLALALLGARALMRADERRLDILDSAGPALAALIVGAFVGLAGAVGVIFVWRVVADARWSVGEARRRAAAAGRPGEIGARALAHAWATPIYGLTVVAYTAPHMLMGLPLDLPHIPMLAPALAAVLGFALIFDWA